MLGGIYINKWKYGSKYVVRFKNIFKRFDSLQEAERFLNGLRFKYDEGTFDPRDYRKDNPLGFENQVKKYLEYKKKLRSFRNLRLHLGYAVEFFGNRNIKSIGYGDLEDFLMWLPERLSSKFKANIMSTLHAFFSWFEKRERRDNSSYRLPEFPKVEYELRWRKIVDRETQMRILDEVKRISYYINPKIWIGIKWLITYIAIRPVELIHIKEEDINLKPGFVVIRYNKEKKPKVVPLLDEDVELIKSLPRGLPHLYFFRHEHRRGASPGERFGKDYLYKWWKKACNNLGIQDVDLYGGTRHSSAVALREFFSPEQIRHATMHSTNQAFERYFRMQAEDLKKIYSKIGVKTDKKAKKLSSKSDTNLIRIFRNSDSCK